MVNLAIRKKRFGKTKRSLEGLYKYNFKKKTIKRKSKKKT